MTALEQATAFVNRYPAMFTEDKEWWALTIASELLEAEKRGVKSFAADLRKDLK